MQDTNDDTDESSAPQLNAIELRVLGVLMEKQLTTPDQYPLTLNSVITACNQKSSRDPITHYTQGEVARALQELDNRHFVRKEHGSRAEKFTQQFMNHLQLGRKQQALLCVMMLRGPQTISELNTRTQRMCEFADKEELDLSIERLCDRGVPYTVRLGQQPGQRGERIAHLFSGTPTDIAASAPKASMTSAMTHPPAAAPPRTFDSHAADKTDQSETVELLQMELTDLTTAVNELKSDMVELKQQLSTLIDQKA